MNKSRLTDAYKFIETLDELTEAKRDHQRFPGYHEAPISFKPTYKCSDSSNECADYINKKEQCPSYTDRILFKNNTSCEWKFNNYTSIPHVLNSDHRPVMLDISIKPHIVNYLDSERLINKTTWHQQRGEIKFKVLKIRIERKGYCAIKGLNSEKI
jgi:hypothetical protein